MTYIIVAAIAFAIGWFLAFRDTSSREGKLQSREAAARAEFERQIAEIQRQRQEKIAEIQRERQESEQFQLAWREEYNRLLQQTRDLHEVLDTGFLGGRRWLADAFSEYIQTRDYELECALVVKPNPASKAAETVSNLRAKRAQMARELKFLQYQLTSYEEYFPVLAEYRDAILDEVVDLRVGASEVLTDVDPALALGYLSKEEYERLSTVEKFQLALDRYWARKKSNVEIGRRYERYIGYLYEKDGWNVRYQGALKGLEDFGRDLICTKGDSAAVVQCKCWSQHKVIREKHIMQLFGTCILYRITEQRQTASPIFVTTTNLSAEASLVAMELDVTVRQEPLKRYPMIKCNVSRASGERIYHLPFDQQYDRVIVGDQPGEFYASTIAEAEAAGFRRAHRWRGDDARSPA